VRVREDGCGLIRYWRNPWNAFSVYFTVEIVVCLLVILNQPQDMQFVAQSASLLLIHMPGLCTILWYVSSVLKETVNIEESSAVGSGVFYAQRSKKGLIAIISIFVIIFVTLVIIKFLTPVHKCLPT